MHKLLKTLEKGVICLSLVALTGACFADVTPARGAAANRGRGATATSRMPSIPVLPVSAVGNMNNGGNVNPTPTPTPDPDPEQPDPDTPVNPTPTPECPDGGVANSDYTIEACMNDVLSCVNGGALPNGINSLFNEDLRNSIVNGMGLCLTQVERCISTVRRNCEYVYESSADVWLDFNARKVQPEYYAFVLRQTGLTPTQAENTCLLLDRNTYGVAFDAVSDSDRVTSEYAQKVGAYNSALNDSLSKNRPLGVEVNTTGLDGQRGYYARWDAERAQCLLRVAAYNKDTLITNSWLFGAIGDDRAAEVWQAAGSTFTCNKNLFDFSLMPKTKTVAATAIPGGTLLGAGIGALAGHGDRDFDCDNKSMREQLFKDLRENNRIAYLKDYMKDPLSTASTTMSASQCKDILNLYDLLKSGREEIAKCDAIDTGVIITSSVLLKIVKCNGEPADRQKVLEETYGADSVDVDTTTGNITITIKGKTETLTQSDLDVLVERAARSCFFKQINKGHIRGDSVHCSSVQEGLCYDRDTFDRELNTLDKALSGLDLQPQESNRLKTTLIGAGTGAAVGGTATAITAFVERNNINCRVADGLAKVGFGKSYTIDRLRDFYVKWALKLPQTIAPTSVVTNCDNWQLTCALFTDLDECASVQFNYRPGNLSSTTLVQNPCRASGSACIANLPVAQANGVCLVTPDTPDEPSVDYPNVKDCNEWQRACRAITGKAECNRAKVIYTPGSMQVSQACRYDERNHICGYNLNKLKQYIDVATCPFGPVPIDPHPEPATPGVDEK